MNNPSDNERLFADALADASPADFRERLLGGPLRIARRKKYVRQARRVGISMGIAAALALWLCPRTMPHLLKPAPAIASYRVIETQPLPASAIVTTRPFADSIVASARPVNIITTAEAHDGVHLLTDDELLSLAPTSTVLVRLGPHSAELILADQNKTVSQ